MDLVSFDSSLLFGAILSVSSLFGLALVMAG